MSDAHLVEHVNQAEPAIAVRKPLKFIHITKTGGSAIEHWGRRHDLLWGAFHKEYGNWSKSSPGKGIWHTFFTMQPLEFKAQFDWFVVVRNPYDRLISEYYCRSLGRPPPLFADRKEGVEHFNRHTRERIEARYPFGDHYSEQYLYIEPGVHVLRFESLALDFAKLMMQYGLPTVLDVRRNVGAKKEFTPADFSAETLRLIHEVYRRDFELFGYTMIKLPLQAVSED